MRQMLSAVVALSTLLAAPFWARADVIYSNLGVGDAYGVFAGYTISGPNSSSLPAHTQAVAFTPVQDAFAGTIELAARLISGLNQLQVSIRDNTNGVPGAVVLEGRQDHVEGTMTSAEGLLT